MPSFRISDDQRRFARKLRREQTKLEDRVWHEVRAKRLGGWKFKRQVPIESYVVDFACFEARLIVEMDGPLHRDAERFLKDSGSDAKLMSHGFRILRFSDNDALGRVIEDIRRALTLTPSPGP